MDAKIKSMLDARNLAVGKLMNSVEAEWRNGPNKDNPEWALAKFQEERDKLVVPEELSKYLDTFHPPL